MRLCSGAYGLPIWRHRNRAISVRRMKTIHIITGVASIVLMGAAGLLGAWLYWRAETSVWFWRLLRAGQVVVVLVAVLRAVLPLRPPTSPPLHILSRPAPLPAALLPPHTP